MSKAQYIGDFVAWTGGAMFIGSGGGTVHPYAHYAIQLVFGAPAGLLVQDGRRGEETFCAGAIIPSRTMHSINVSECDWSTVIFVEPETAVGRALTKRTERRIQFLRPEELSGCVPALDKAWRADKNEARVRDAACNLILKLSGIAPYTPPMRECCRPLSTCVTIRMRR